MMEKHNKIGTVPSGWKMKKLKDVFYINESSLPSNTPADYQFRYITIEQVSTNHIDFGNCETFRFSDAPGRARRIVRDKDILISGVRPNLKSFAIFNNPDAGNWICSTGFFVLTAKNEDDNLISYYELLSEIGERQFYSYVAGSNYPAIGDSDIRNIRLVLPSSVKEKTAIANILSKVDEAIAAVQGSIAAAERLKKSLMQNLLTGRMKPDGTLRKEDEFYMDEKFGKVPKGWEIEKFGKRVIVLYGKSQKDVVSENGTIPVYGTGGIIEYATQALCNHKSILVGRKGTIDKPFYIDKPFWAVDTTYYVDMFIDGNMRYLYYMLLRMNLGNLNEATGVPSVTRRTLNRQRLIIPPIDEQNSIVNVIDKIEKQIIKKQSRIATLERLKKSLMQNLLTGRVKVIRKLNN